eukprot:TRINITY_DN22512_c0_g1_i1.p1 TRINITY_DN22512_c0_g1~~TRINITY_DN22512_c0_g1_i1.p1  ORF type:complete len:441 (+),score=117.75 TRINITY_DN22512_c0_g1_i1:1682-3004(+)
MPIFTDAFIENVLEKAPWMKGGFLDPSPPPVAAQLVRRSAVSVGAWIRDFFREKGFELVMLGVSMLALGWFYRSLDPTRSQKKAAKKQADDVLRSLGVGQKRGAMPELDSYEQMVAADIVLPDSISVTLDDIGGLEDVKERLYESLILPLNQPHLFQRGRLLAAPKGILLYGPPGTGKTMLAKAVAKTSEAVFINVNVATVMQKWMGESEKLVQAIFSLANKLEPSIIFIDEIDCLFQKRSEQEHELSGRIKASFMTLWDGLNTNPNARITIIGATNRPAALDEAIQRRMPQTFQIGLPEFKQRVSILRIILRDEPVEEGFDVEQLARETEGYSGSDLQALAESAARFAVRDYVRSAAGRPTDSGGSLRAITLGDFREAMTVVGATGAAANAYATQQRASVWRGARSAAPSSSSDSGAGPVNYNFFFQRRDDAPPVEPAD